MLQNNPVESTAGTVGENRVALFFASGESAKYRPLVVRMFIACVTVAIALMIMVPSVAKAADMVNLNKANIESLQTLPDIGEKRAKAIISYRKKNGGFKDKKDLLNVPGIGDKILAKISRRVSVTGGGLSVGSSSKDSKKAKAKSSAGSKDKKADKRSLSKSSKDKATSKDSKKAKKKTDEKVVKKKSSSSSKKTKKKKKKSSSCA